MTEYRAMIMDKVAAIAVMLLMISTVAALMFLALIAYVMMT